MIYKACLQALLLSVVLAGCQSSKLDSDAQSSDDNQQNTELSSSDALQQDAGDIDASGTDIGTGTGIGTTTNASIAKSSNIDSSTKNVIGGYRAPKVGTIFYWQNNWNSLPKNWFIR